MAALEVNDQSWYATSKAYNPEGLKAWVLDALHKGGRLLQNSPEDVANGQPRYATYAQLYADLQATAPDIAAGLPSPDRVRSDPITYAGVTSGDVFNENEFGAATPVPAPTPQTHQTPAVDPAAEDAQKTRMKVFTQMGGILNDLGMGELFGMTNDSAGIAKPGGWLWDQIVAGTVADPASLNIALEATPVWQRLYGGVINEQRKAAKADPTTVHIMTPIEVAQYRQTANQLARQYNLPANFYDDPHDWDAQMIGQVDPTELQHRIALAWNDVANADPTVQKAFDAYHGTNSAQQMAAFFLDPTHSMANLDLSAREAVVGGAGARYGFGLVRPLAERIARNGVTQTAAEQIFGQLQQGAAFYRPTMGEQGDLTTTAIEQGFGVGDNASGVLDLERRRNERVATTTQEHGGPVQTRTGVVGVGPAR